MSKIILEILSLIKTFLNLKLKKLEKEIKIQDKKNKEKETLEEKIHNNNENIRKENVDDIAMKMKEYSDFLTKQKSQESSGKKK